jgi:hypothetical protein
MQLVDLSSRVGQLEVDFVHGSAHLGHVRQVKLGMGRE